MRDRAAGGLQPLRWWASVLAWTVFVPQVVATGIVAVDPEVALHPARALFPRGMGRITACIIGLPQSRLGLLVVELPVLGIRPSALDLAWFRDTHVLRPRALRRVA